MFKLRYGYLLSGIITGCVLLFSFTVSLPDKNLHIVVCDVGQGDATYIRFPDGHDMLIDGGPDDRVLTCLGKHMPFWDRTIDVVALSHPQKDHFAGLQSVVERFRIGFMVKSNIEAPSDGYRQLMAAIARRHIPIKLMTRGQTITVGATSFAVIWPSEAQMTFMKPHTDVLGATTDVQLNDGSVVLLLRYGAFDAIFPGDADNHVDGQFDTTRLADSDVELLKVPHHGSQTGMTEDFVRWLQPKIAVISVGKNSYGHPSREAMDMLTSMGAKILRTDQHGDVEVVTDGNSWWTK